ncbi:sialate O-acetylesterase [Flavicella sediminum]|uniref:sialate O-acetylesterase n=1 Tax=Flavicella sediminum TaxID=2585141 RepID=UPI0011234EB8|nr:sialate O-acetylesterase [Flavicella sediminum]
MHSITNLIFSFCLFFSSVLMAQTKLVSLFNDHMVLQQNTNVSIWGTDKPKTKISIHTTWGETISVSTNKNGNWKATLKTTTAGGPYEVKVTGTSEVILKDVLLGEVWLCSGQSNMEISLKGNPGQPIDGSNHAIATSKNNQLRVFKVAKAMDLTKQEDCEGNWVLSSPNTAAAFSATAYFYGKMLQEQLGVPVGLIISSYGATPAEAWTPMKTIEAEGFNDLIKVAKETKKINRRTPSVLYNAMIHPLIPYTIKGAIWYQGEGNHKQAKAYQKLFSAMIKTWRSEWKLGEFPFYFVQLASLGWPGQKWIDLQQAQLKTMLSVPNTGMVVTNDIGSIDCIHPPKKKQVGERLAYWALANDYGFSGVEFSGPVYKSKQIKGAKIYLNFEYAPNGLTSLDKEFTDFEIAGADNQYYEANVKLTKKGSLYVWSDKVKQPKNVRYGWKSYIEGSLYNTAGLPASSFTTEEN